MVDTFKPCWIISKAMRSEPCFPPSNFFLPINPHKLLIYIETRFLQYIRFQIAPQCLFFHLRPKFLFHTKNHCSFYNLFLPQHNISILEHLQMLQHICNHSRKRFAKYLFWFIDAFSFDILARKNSKLIYNLLFLKLLYSIRQTEVYNHLFFLMK